MTIIENTTITRNTAPTNGGSGVANLGELYAQLEVKNTIIAGNTNTDVDIVRDTINSIQSKGYNLIGDGNAIGQFNQPGDLVNVSEPKLGVLTYNEWTLCEEHIRSVVYVVVVYIEPEENYYRTIICCPRPIRSWCGCLDL